MSEVTILVTVLVGEIFEFLFVELGCDRESIVENLDPDTGCFRVTRGEVLALIQLTKRCYVCG